MFKFSDIHPDAVEKRQPGRTVVCRASMTVLPVTKTPSVTPSFRRFSRLFSVGQK